MRDVVEHDTGSHLARSLVPALGVICRRCRYRSLLSAVQIQAHEHDRRKLSGLPLLCRCGSKDVQRVLLDTLGERDAFLS